MKNIEYRFNPRLPFLDEVKNWNGNPHSGKVFFDPNYKLGSSFTKFLKWQLGPKPQRQEKKSDPFRLKTSFISDLTELPSSCLIWLGHASFLLRINRWNILIDPVLYDLPFIPRMSVLPLRTDTLRNIDFVLLTHAHRDHCDENSLRYLAEHNRFTLICGLGTSGIVRPWLRGQEIIEAGWYQYIDILTELRFTYLPCRHWSNRYPWDTNQSLWGSIMISGKDFNIYMGGDSAWSDYYKNISEIFTDIDLAALGCGAYSPRFMMESVHMNPFETLLAAETLNVRKLIPMHYGTFSLSDEPPGEPHRILNQAAAEGRYTFSINLDGPGNPISW